MQNAAHGARRLFPTRQAEGVQPLEEGECIGVCLTGRRGALCDQRLPRAEAPAGVGRVGIGSGIVSTVPLHGRVLAEPGGTGSDTSVSVVALAGGDADAIRAAGRTRSSGALAWRSTPPATLPNTTRLRPVRPWVLITTRSARRSRVASAIAWAGSSSRTSIAGGWPSDAASLRATCSRYC